MVFTLFYYLRISNDISYQGEKYDLRQVEGFVKLFKNYNSGDFLISKVFENNNRHIIKMYHQFEEEDAIWVELKGNNLFDIDSSTISLNDFQEIDNSKLLDGRGGGIHSMFYR